MQSPQFLVLAVILLFASVHALPVKDLPESLQDPYTTQDLTEQLNKFRALDAYIEAKIAEVKEYRTDNLIQSRWRALAMTQDTYEKIADLIGGIIKELTIYLARARPRNVYMVSSRSRNWDSLLARMQAVDQCIKNFDTLYSKETTCIATIRQKIDIH